MARNTLGEFREVIYAAIKVVDCLLEESKINVGLFESIFEGAVAALLKTFSHLNYG